MAVIYLHGEMKEKYGEKFVCKVPTGSKALQLLLCQIKGLHDDLKNGFFTFRVCGKIVSGKDENESIGNAFRALSGPVGIDEEIHITPAVQGSGSNGGIFMVVAGIVAVAAAFFTGGASIAAWSAATAAMAASGAMMVAGGVAMMLTKMPAATMPKSDNNSNEQKSTGFNSVENMAGQGQAIALIYGRNKIGSAVVSQQIQTLTRGIN